MKALIFISQPLAMIGASVIFDWIAYILFGLFLFGSFALVFISLYRHLAANRYF